MTLMFKGFIWSLAESTNEIWLFVDEQECNTANLCKKVVFVSMCGLNK